MSSVMFSTEELFQKGRIDGELRGLILENCEACGYPIMRTFSLTKAACSNKLCPEKLAQRAAVILKALNVKGIGIQTCRSFFSSGDKKNAMEILALVEQKPEMELWEVVKYNFPEGLSNSLQTFVKGFPLPKVLEYMEEDVKYCLQFVDLKEKCTNTVNIEVMIHGAVLGFSSRDTYIRYLNDEYGNYFNIIQCGVKKSADYLLTSDPHLSGRKCATAKCAGIPIMEPAEFENMLQEIISEHEGSKPDSIGEESMSDVEDII